jgi:hypothetical protein
MRIAIGALIGLALTAAGWRAARKNYRIPQSLCATGILVLYADILLRTPSTLDVADACVRLDVCVTIAAFLAVVLDAQVVVILGLLGGFLLRSARDRAITPGGAFPRSPERGRCGFACVNVGLSGSSYAIRTVVTEFAWVGDFSRYESAHGFVIFAASSCSVSHLFVPAPKPEVGNG